MVAAAMSSIGYEQLPATKMLASHCLYCAKPLEQPHSIERGAGDICAEKYMVFTPSASVDPDALAKALAAAPEKMRLAVQEAIGVDPREAVQAEQREQAIAALVGEAVQRNPSLEEAMKRVNHLAGSHWFRGTEDAPLYIGSAIEIAGALGFERVQEKLTERYIEGVDRGGPPGGFPVVAVGGSMWRLALPYEQNYSIWKATVAGLFKAGAREVREGRKRFYDFDMRDWVKVLNVLSQNYANRLGTLPSGEVFVVPSEQIPVGPPPEQEPTGAPTSATGESKVRPSDLAIGMAVELNDGRTMVIGWMSADRSSIGVVTPDLARKSLEQRGRISPGYGGYNGNPDASFLGVENVKQVAPSKEVIEEVEKTVTETVEKPETPAPRRAPRALPAEMFDYQREGAVWLDTQQSGILAFEQGLGKTLTSIAVMDAPIVVVCPAKLRINWVREITRWRPDLSVAAVGVEQMQGGKVRKAAGKVTRSALAANVVVINYDTLAKNVDALIERGCATLVCDEAHFVKELRLTYDRDSRAYFPAKSTPKRAGAVWKLAQIAKRRLLLTGTPIKNRPAELWSLLHLVAPQRWPKFHDYCLQYCDAYKSRFGWDYTGSSNLGELNEIISGTYMLRRKKDDVLDLPEKSRRSIKITIEESAAKQYEHAAREFLEWVRANGGPEAVMRAMRAEALTKMTALRRIAAAGKAAHVAEEVVGHIDSTGRPLVVMGWHKTALEALIGAIEEANVGRAKTGDKPIRVGRVMGGYEAQKDIDAFQHGEPRDAPEEDRDYIDVLVCNIQAAGVGLTLTRAREMFFLERHWTPADLVQAEDRIHRIGQKNDVTITYYDAAGTIDEYLSGLLLSKVKTVAQVIDGLDLPEEDAGEHVFGQLFESTTEMTPNRSVVTVPEAYDWGNPAV